MPQAVNVSSQPGVSSSSNTALSGHRFIGEQLQGRAQALSDVHDSNVGNISRRIRTIRAGANLASQRDGSNQFGGGPRGFARQLSQAEKRGKIRAGINARGDKAVRNQQLKDRLSLMRASIQKRGGIIQDAATRARIKAGGEAAQADIRANLSASRASSIGGLAGSAAGFAKDFFSTGDLGQGIMDQQNELDIFLGGNDFGVDNTLGQGFDFGSLPSTEGLS